MIDRDFIVLGAGNAGLAAAGFVRKTGQSVTVIESRDVGGTCPLRGCVPKKVLVAAAEVLDHISIADQHHINIGEPVLDWKQLMVRKESFVQGVPGSFAQGLQNNGIEVIHGSAKFVNTNTIVTNGQHYRGKKFLIATGSVPRQLPIPGFETTLTSDDLLSLQYCPKSLVFIGGGVIAFELAHVFARANTHVTIVQTARRPLAKLDTDIAKNLIDATRRLGVEIICDAKTEAIEKQGNNYRVYVDYNGQKHIIETQLVANTAGRIADIEPLKLQVANVEFNSQGILVDDYLRSTTNPNVYAAGDVLPNMQLSPLATYEGKIVGNNITREKKVKPNYLSIPHVVFTIPAAASVGLTEVEALAQKLDINVMVNDMRDWRSARTHAESTAYAKVLIEKGSRRIVGAHLLGHGAQETIHLFSMAMKFGITADELKDNTYAYPTFSSDIQYLV